MNIEFDITKAPPSADALAQELLEAAVTREELRFLDIGYSIACVFLGLAMVGLTLFIVGENYENRASWFYFLVGAALGSGVFLTFGSILARLAGMGAGVGGGIVGVFFFILIAISQGHEFAGQSGGFGAFIAVGISAFLFWETFYRLIESRRMEASATLDRLVELEVSTMGDECIEFMQWVDADETVRAYQQKMAAMGRKPVVGEYRAARAWVENREQRLIEQEKMERVREACARMTGQAANA